MHIRHRRIPTLRDASTALVSLGAVIGLALSTSTAGAISPSNVVVTQNDLATDIADVTANPTKWFFYNDETDQIDTSLGSMVAGPGTPPMGDGSAQMSVSGTQRRNLATYQFSGTKLSDITELKFSTYNPSAGNGGSATRSAYLNFNIDFNGTDTWQRRIAYVPNQNGTVQQDQWQEWDAIDGGAAQWSYSGPTWPVTGEPGSTLKTWSQILSDYPDVRIRVTDSWLGLRVGEPYANGYTENVDKFVFGTAAGTTVFDFDIDSTKPTVSITDPANGDVLDTGSFTASGTAADTSGIDHVLYTVTKITGLGGTYLASVDNGTANGTTAWDFSVSDLADGFYRLKVQAFDAAGNWRYKYIDVQVASVPTDKDQCKNGGWQTFTTLGFKNQGDCIKYVKHHDDDRGHHHHHDKKHKHEDRHHERDYDWFGFFLRRFFFAWR